MTLDDEITLDYPWNVVEANRGTYKVIHRDHNTFLDIARIEEKMKAKYVGEFSLPNKEDDWLNQPVSVFYAKKKHPEGSNYFGLLRTITSINPNGTPQQTTMICNAIGVTRKPWTGVLDPVKNIVIYSAFRHDYQTYENLMADGGQEYVRCSSSPLVKLLVTKGTIEVERI